MLQVYGPSMTTKVLKLCEDFSKVHNEVEAVSLPLAAEWEDYSAKQVAEQVSQRAFLPELAAHSVPHHRIWLSASPSQPYDISIGVSSHHQSRSASP